MTTFKQLEKRANKIGYTLEKGSFKSGKINCKYKFQIKNKSKPEYLLLNLVSVKDTINDISPNWYFKKYAPKNTMYICYNCESEFIHNNYQSKCPYCQSFKIEVLHVNQEV